MAVTRRASQKDSLTFFNADVCAQPTHAHAKQTQTQPRRLSQATAKRPALPVGLLLELASPPEATFAHSGLAAVLGFLLLAPLDGVAHGAQLLRHPGASTTLPPTVTCASTTLR